MKIAILVDSHDEAEPLAELALDYFSDATSCESNLSLRRELKETPRPDLILVQVSNLAGRFHELAALHSGLDGGGYVPFVVVVPSADTELHDQLASKGLDMLYAPVAAKAFEAMVCMCLPDHMEALYAERSKARSESCS